MLRGDPLIIDDLEHCNVNTLNRMKCSGELETLGDVVFSGTEVSSNSSLAERDVTADRPRLLSGDSLRRTLHSAHCASKHCVRT